MTYQSALDYLYSRLPVFHNIGAAAYKPGLANTVKILDYLGNPQKKFKSIHIAGTNGKGSVSHTLAAVFQSAGYKTGLYTSPHLLDFGERIRLNGKMIERSYVADFVENHQAIVQQVQPSFFELTMAMAFAYFAENDIDIAIVETGLGGRLDSTNILVPELSIITNISYDHTQFLGNTLQQIAAEKAGIIKPDIPVVIGEWQSETHNVFENKALETNSKLYYPENAFEFIANDNNKMLCRTTDLGEIRVALTGNYQLKNMATVFKAINVINDLGQFILPENAILDGIENVVELTGLRGRWEIIQTSPLVITDTGHNQAGIEYVAQQIKNQTYNKLHIVFGVVNDKDVSAMLSFLPKNAEYYFTQAKVERALSAEELAVIALQFGLKGKIYPTIASAYQSALNNASSDDFIFVGGSNYVVGEFLSGL